MTTSQMVVFNQYFMPATIETLAQMVSKFNAASGGAIRLTTDGFDGDFLQESFYAAIHSAQRRVDRYASNTTASTTDLTQAKHSSVKIAGGFGPIRYEPAQMTWLNKPTAEGIEVASRNFAEAMLKDQLNTAVAALVAAIGQQGATTTVDVSTGSGAKVIDYATVNNSHALFGDHSSLIAAQIMSGASYHAFVGQNLTNTERLFQAGTVRIVDIMGNVTIITDAPALYTAAVVSPAVAAKRRVLSLVAGAATVSDGGDVVSNIQTTNGNLRIETTLQIDYTFGLGLKGYTWDETYGGKSPTDAEIGTGTNWDKIASDIKHTAGTLAVGLA
ncbi:MAG: hypothetical protein IPL79_20285 [Myxococcales bacterium]|nr:hypothetical protein [Myxococcales bacterium]